MKTKENQNNEWKKNWKDEYLKWICGFANAQGGTLYIGKDDIGNIVGINNAKKISEDIPNKIKNILGIVIDVNLHTENQKDYLEIITAPHPYPVNYKGQYHYRSGSTKLELTGDALNHFMLKKQGKNWDAVPVPNVVIDDLKRETLEYFRKLGIDCKRIDDSALKETTDKLIENLKLKEGNFLKRAAILLFHPDPEKYVTGAYVKIGFFQTNTELIFQDEIHGNLFEQAEKTIDIIFTKYIKAIISYEGIHRIETYEYPKEAIREAVLNALSHKNYASGIPIQISVYEDKIIIWNDGRLPENWTVEKLTQQHPSKPFNPDIANAFFRSGYIESWGRGTIKIVNMCLEAGLPKPIYNCQSADFQVNFQKDIYTESYLKTTGINERQIKAISYVKKNKIITNKNYQEINDIGKTIATEELSELVKKELLKKLGSKGKSSKYVIGQ